MILKHKYNEVNNHKHIIIHKNSNVNDSNNKKYILNKYVRISNIQLE